MSADEGIDESVDEGVDETPEWSSSPPGSLRDRAEGRAIRSESVRDTGRSRVGPLERRRWLTAVLAVGLAVVVPLAGLFAFLWQRADSGTDVEDVRRTAGVFAERFLTVDSENLEATRDGVLELSTGAFRRNYEEALETGVFEAILSLGRTRTETAIDEIFVGDVDGRAAHVIVQAEVISRTVDAEGEEQPPRVLELFLELDLVRQSDGWFVDNVRNLNLGGGPPTTGSQG